MKTLNNGITPFAIRKVLPPLSWGRLHLEGVTPPIMRGIVPLSSIF